MKRTLLFMTAFTATIYVNAQGTWKAVGTEAAVAAGTEIPMNIASLKSMHSDASTVTGKSDTGAETVSYNGITYDNLAFIQGSTNGMYFAFQPSKNGTLDISIKMGSAKKTFVLELTDALWTNLGGTAGDLAKLTTTKTNGTDFTGTAAYFTTPSVYDTHHKTNGIWDGSANFQETGANVYVIMSFSVTANKTYVVGCFGSKLMLRGVNLALTSNLRILPGSSAPEIYPNPAFQKVIINVAEPTEISFYNTSGSLVKQQQVTASQNTVNISDLCSGLYFIRSENDKSFIQKLVVK